jgi:hypothetical protein
LSEIDFNILDLEDLILQSEKSLKNHIKSSSQHKIQVIHNDTRFYFKNNEIGSIIIFHEISKTKYEKQTIIKPKNHFEITKFFLFQIISLLFIFLFLKYYIYKI